MSPLHLTSVALAIAGAACSVAATAGRTSGRLSPLWAGRLTTLGYSLMGASVLIFVIRGFITL